MAWYGAGCHLDKRRLHAYHGAEIGSINTAPIIRSGSTQLGAAVQGFYWMLPEQNGTATTKLWVQKGMVGLHGRSDRRGSTFAGSEKVFERRDLQQQPEIKKIQTPGASHIRLIITAIPSQMNSTNIFTPMGDDIDKLG